MKPVKRDMPVISTRFCHLNFLLIKVTGIQFCYDDADEFIPQRRQIVLQNIIDNEDIQSVVIVNNPVSEIFDLLPRYSRILL